MASRYLSDLGRTTRLGCLALLLSMSVMAPAHAASGQVVEGRVLAPVPAPSHCDLTQVGEAALIWAARIDLTPVTQGSSKYRFAVEPGTRGEPFVLETIDPAADFDLVFYGMGYAQRFGAVGVGGEDGIVPLWADEALVCLSSGAAASFRYTAGRV